MKLDHWQHFYRARFFVLIRQEAKAINAFKMALDFCASFFADERLLRRSGLRRHGERRTKRTNFARASLLVGQRSARGVPRFLCGLELALQNALANIGAALLRALLQLVVRVDGSDGRL